MGVFDYLCAASALVAVAVVVWVAWSREGK
jgi:hypothetical protein